jgi:hypothetical protein
MSSINLSGTVTNPEKMSRCVVISLSIIRVRLCGDGICCNRAFAKLGCNGRGNIWPPHSSGQSLLILEEKALMACEKIYSLELSCCIGTNSTHESERVGYRADNISIL